MPGCGVGERARRGRDPWVPPLPLPPRREDPHHEERDEDDQEEPGTVTVIERDLRLLGQATGADVGPHVGPANGCSLVRAPWSELHGAILTPQARSGSPERTRNGAWSWGPWSCRGVVGPRYERPYGSSHALARIAGGAVPAYHGGAPLILTLREIVMDQELETQQWLLKAGADLRRVTNAETRFSAAMSMNHVTMLAAADELEAATREAMTWMAGNPCPDREVGARVGLMLSTCAEVAFTAEMALTNSAADIEAVFGRLGDLLAIIDFHSETLKAW
jgi:hypothetical protein